MPARDIVAKGTAVLVVPFALAQGARKIEARQQAVLIVQRDDMTADDVQEIVEAAVAGRVSSEPESGSDLA